MKLLKNSIYITGLILIALLVTISAYAQDENTIIKKKFKASIIENEHINGGYLVKKGKKYGIVDYDYNLKIPIKYNSMVIITSTIL